MEIIHFSIYFPLYSYFVRYDCSNIEHVRLILFTQLIILLGVLNLEIITSIPHLECLHCVICV